MKPVKKMKRIFSPPADDQRGVYGLFYVILMPIIIIVIGIAIDGPRQLTALQRTQDIAEQASRYAASLIATNDSANELPITTIEKSTKKFVATQNLGTYGGRNVDVTISCDSSRGEIEAIVTGTISNTFSALIFGTTRSFTSSAKTSLLFASPGSPNSKPINLCFATPIPSS